jgi:hypothetical protein
MWIFTPLGFFSVVQKPDDDRLTVRARFAGDLERLRDAHLPELGAVAETPAADYRFRARVDRAAFARALSALATAIDYDNFKSTVARRQGKARAAIYGDVWEILHEAQRRRA